MAKRRFEMFRYRQVIHRLRMGQSDRAVAKTRLMGRLNFAQVRAIAEKNGWLGDGPLPADDELAAAFEPEQPANPTHQSLSLPHEPQIRKWIHDGICWSMIHQTLVDQFGFPSSYFSVRRLAQKLRKQNPRATRIRDFAPAEAA